jgi:hypothetical protein
LHSSPRSRLSGLFVSPVTFAEIRFGIELVADANRRAALSEWLTHAVRPMFEERVLDVTEDVMFKWRLLGRRRPQSRAHFLATRSHRCVDGAAPRAYGRFPRPA